MLTAFGFLAAFVAGCAAAAWWHSRDNDDALDPFIDDMCRALRDPAEDWMTLMHDMDGDGWYVSIVNAERDLEVCAEADEYSPGPVIKPSVPIVGARHQRMLDDAVAVARTHELQRKLGIIPSAAELRDAMKENARG